MNDRRQAQLEKLECEIGLLRAEERLEVAIEALAGTEKCLELFKAADETLRATGSMYLFRERSRILLIELRKAIIERENTIEEARIALKKWEARNET